MKPYYIKQIALPDGYYVLIDGIKVYASIPLCMYGKGKAPVQLIVGLAPNTSGPSLTDPSITMSSATEDDIVRLLSGLRIATCSCCSNKRLDFSQASMCQSDRKHIAQYRTAEEMLMCSECLGKSITARWKQEEEAAKAKDATDDAKQKAAGMRYKTVAWVHAGGDDKQIVIYTTIKPSKKFIAGELSKLKSRVLDDFTTTLL